MQHSSEGLPARATVRCLWLVASAWPAIAVAQTHIDLGYPQHDRNRPQPATVDPGTSGSLDMPGRPPPDAVVLFDGRDLSKWRQKDGSATQWKLGAGYFEVVPGTGQLYTRESFGDCQLHLEFAEPTPAHGEDQDRGNSGVFLHDRYEVQVLDSYQSQTYPDGQAGAIFGQFPPLVNASRAPGLWQTYDIVFHGPRFDAAGHLTRPARMTVFFNGVLVQDDVELTGPTAHQKRPPYVAEPDMLPLSLQDHGSVVRYRNIWIRQLAEHH